MKNALRQALDERGYSELTPVQKAVLAPEHQGADLLVSAQTGSGKTLGFGLSIAPQILGDGEHFERAAAPLALIIAPTRELALQVKRELAWLYEKAGAYMASCVGGMDIRDERRSLARGAHIVVATPGRLRDHIMRGTINLEQVKSVVLDEADEMLDLGFREDLEFILGSTPEERQTLLFSATVPNSIAGLAKKYQKDAIRVVVKSETKQHADIRHLAYDVAPRDTENAVINTLLFHKAPNAIVFGNTRATVNRMTTRLSNRGFRVVALSGELSQAERSNALQAMRDGRADVCVATDVAARGIDLPNLDLVIHAELPNNFETMLHRSGRTGRAGRKGVSAMIVTKTNRRKAQRILSMAKVDAEWGSAPSADQVRDVEAGRLLSHESLSRAITDKETETVTQLVEKFSAEQLAAAFLRAQQEQRSAPEELADVDSKPPKREDFGPSVWFSITGGQAAGAEPRRVLPMLCDKGGLDKSDIGAIRVQQDQTFFEIKAKAVNNLNAALPEGNEIEPGAIISQLDTPPVIEPRGRPGGDRGGKFDNRGGGKPRYDGKPRTYEKKEWGAGKEDRPRKPKYDDRPAAPYKDKPKRDAETHRAAEPVGKKKPYEGKKKPGGKFDSKKPAGKFEGKKPGGKFEGKPGGKFEGKKPGAKPKPKAEGGASEGGFKKGPPPPKGKSNSKKNRARALAAAANATPKRK